ncbi:MAG: secretin N-terminal domain-containing protein [Myxococcota bacterium]
MKLAGKMLGKALLALVLAAPLAARGAEFELYRPSHRSAEELAALVDPVLGAEGRAVADSGTGVLLLTGEADGLARARTLLRKLDVPLTRYLVESRIESREALRLRGYTLESELDLGPLRIARLAEPEPARPVAQGRVHFWELTSRDERRSEHSLQVLEGRTAELWTGSLIPIRVRNFDLPTREERVLETEPLLSLQTGFQLRPRSLGKGELELELVAVTTGGHPAAEISRTSSATRLRLRLGDWVVVRQLATSHTLTGSAPLTSWEQRDTERDELLLFRILLAPDN